MHLKKKLYVTQEPLGVCKIADTIDVLCTDSWIITVITRRLLNNTKENEITCSQCSHYKNFLKYVNSIMIAFIKLFDLIEVIAILR